MNDENQNPHDFDDFEMGSDDDTPKSNSETPETKPQSTQDIPSEQPVINHYNNPAATPQTVQPTENIHTPEVNPQAEAPEAPKPQPQVSVPHTQQSAPVSPQKPNTPPPKKINKKAMITLLATFGGFMGLFLILAFFFIAQSGGVEVSPIARLLGLNNAIFVNGLIAFIHIIFLLTSLTLFVVTMVGLFKASMAKKDDKEAKKKGLKTSIIAGSLLILFVIIWGFVYIYLDAKRIITDPEQVAPDIITEPEEPLNLSAPVEVRFDATNITFDSRKYQIVAHEWDFGDGETGTSQIVAHRYTQKGTYDVKLKITIRDKNTGEVGLGGEYSLTVSVTNEALGAKFSADPQSGEAPLEVTFDASDSSDPDGFIDTYEWDLDGDGEFDDAEGETVDYTFEKIGKYNVALRVTSTTGEFDVAEKEITVKDSVEPEAQISVVNEPDQYLVNTSYVFKADESTSPNGDIVSYSWDFGDGSREATTKTISHSFDRQGTYEVTLTVTDEEGKEGEISKLITVGTPSSAPRAVLNTDKAPTAGTKIVQGEVPFTVNFDANKSVDSDDDIVNYSWDLNGDGSYDKFGIETNYTYTSSGTYLVTLEVEDSEGQTDDATITIQVDNQGITAELTADKIEGSVPLTISFDASSSRYPGGQITSYKWNFGDGSSEKLGSSKMTHKYTSIGTYNVSVTAVGADNTQDTTNLTVTVREIPLSACFTTVFEQGPAPLETTFDPSCSNGTVSSYFWSFGDGGTSTKIKPRHTFENAGIYNVILEISDSDSNISQFEKVITVSQ